MPDARDWIEADTPIALLQHARKYPPSNLPRALKLFAIHASRLALPAILDVRSTGALDTAERHLFGLATDADLASATAKANTAHYEARGAYEDYAVNPATRSDHRGRAERMSNSLGAHVAFHAAHTGFYDGMLAHVRDALAFRSLLGKSRRDTHRLTLCNILREVVANPFQKIAFVPEWHTDTVAALARQIVFENDFGAMPILADALQDAGCDSDDLLNHCRDTSQVHLRGCWVLELVLSSA